MAHNIDSQEVERIAALARLALGDQEKAKAAKDLSGILEHFSAIQHIDTSNVLPVDDASGLQNIAREDVACADLLCNSQQVLEAVPALQDGQVQVRAVFT